MLSLKECLDLAATALARRLDAYAEQRRQRLLARRKAIPAAASLCRDGPGVVEITYTPVGDGTGWLREPQFDKRITRGDGFAADAWRNPKGEITYTALGCDPRTASSDWTYTNVGCDPREIAGMIDLKILTDDDAPAGIQWWNGLSEKERKHWLEVAQSARPVDAWHEFQQSMRTLVQERKVTDEAADSFDCRMAICPHNFKCVIAGRCLNPMNLGRPGHDSAGRKVQ